MISSTIGIITHRDNGGAEVLGMEYIVKMARQPFNKARLVQEKNE
jgi:hypothetical protein